MDQTLAQPHFDDFRIWNWLQPICPGKSGNTNWLYPIRPGRGLRVVCPMRCVCGGPPCFFSNKQLVFCILQIIVCKIFEIVEQSTAVELNRTFLFFICRDHITRMLAINNEADLDFEGGFDTRACTCNRSLVLVPTRIRPLVRWRAP